MDYPIQFYVGDYGKRPISQQVKFDKRELQNQLIPFMRKNTVDDEESWVLWTDRLLQECKNALSVLLPFSTNENEFLNQLYNHGHLDATLLTSDRKMI